MNGVNLIQRAAEYAALVLPLVGANPLITTVALAILTSDKWMPQANAGPCAYGLCYQACMFGLVVALPGGGVIGPFAPYSITACKLGCAPWLSPTFP